jgi:hypothetical protein
MVVGETVAVVAGAVVVVVGETVAVVAGAVVVAVVGEVVVPVVVNFCVTAGAGLVVFLGAAQPYKPEKRITKIRSAVRNTAAHSLKNTSKNFFIFPSELLA